MRAFANDCLWHDLRRKMNLIAPKCGFVKIILNGKSLGSMHYVEKTNYLTIERLKRKPGVIIAPNEKKLWYMYQSFFSFGAIITPGFLLSLSIVK